MTEQEPPSIKFIEIDAPVELTRDQNLYDQPPFDGLIEVVSDGLNLSSDLLRYGLSITCRDRDSIDDPMLIPGVYNLRNSSYRGGSIGFRTSEKIHAALKLLVAGLKPYPYWKDYLHYKGVGMEAERTSRYSLMGAYKNYTRERLYLPTPSYAKYATQRTLSDIKIDQAAIKLVLAEEFPYLSSSQVGTLITEGHGRNWRKWRILEASEITRRKAS